MFFMNIVLGIAFFVIGGCWRRLFGGWLSDKPIISNRFFQHLIGFFILDSMFYYSGMSWYFSLLYAIIIQGFFWSPGHGAFFDLGRNNDGKDPKMIKRYNKTLGNRIVDWMLPNRYNYRFFYDFLGMAFRYTLPCLLLCYHFPQMLFIGLSIAPIYSFCWTFFEKEKENIYLPLFISHATALAEFLCGGLLYSGLFFILY